MTPRYGTVPIVHATGGLKDTVADYSAARLAAGTASGFSFATSTPPTLPSDAACLDLYSSERQSWRALQRLCRDSIFVDKSAHAYRDLYQHITA